MNTEKNEENNLSQETSSEEILENESAEETAAETENSTDDLLIEQQDRIAQLEQELADLKDSTLRKIAEYDNMKKRLQRERVQIFEQAKSASVEAFLPINDDLIRRLEAAEKAGGDSVFVEGLKLITGKFAEILERNNVEMISETGVPFDVDLHDALLRQKPDDESIGSDIVLQVLENGYRMGDKTIRHAKVIVSE
jgi:molecular chaperone GrpE